jgi:mycothiol synthase
MLLRAPTFDDAEAVHDVIRARNIADLGRPDVTLEDVREEWELPDVELSLDAVVVEDEGRIIGYGIVLRQGGLGVVAPEYEGLGAGSLLLPWLERRQHELSRSVYRQWIGATNVHARELLLATGYERVRSYTRLVRDLRATPPERGEHAPDGFLIRMLEIERDGPAVYELDDRAFSPRPDYTPSSWASFNAEHFLSHDFDARLSLVADYGGSLAGFLLTRRWEDEGAGYISVLAVGPEHQRRGLGEALLRTAFVAVGTAGLPEAALDVASDNEHARRLYERVGMRPRFQNDTYERPVA